MNEKIRSREEALAEMPQCLEGPTIPCESEEQRERREQSRRIDILKIWEIKIQPLDRGCTVSVGCKNFAFENIDAAMETVKQYVDNPFAVIKHYGFEKYL